MSLMAITHRLQAQFALECPREIGAGAGAAIYRYVYDTGRCLSQESARFVQAKKTAFEVRSLNASPHGLTGRPRQPIIFHVKWLIEIRLQDALNPAHEGPDDLYRAWKSITITRGVFPSEKSAAKYWCVDEPSDDFD
jgi:hypothetical protein